MKLLLDSHILLRWAGGSARRGTRARELVADDSQLFVSAAAGGKLAIKKVLGRLQIDLGATRDAIAKRGVAPVAVTLQHAEVAATLDKLHGDPFDHMLVAQAVAEGLMHLTRDSRLKGYGANILCV